MFSLINLKRSPLTLLMSWIIATVMFTTMPNGTVFAASAPYLPAPGIMLDKSAAYNPVTLKGIKFYPNDPFKLEFIIDEGNTAMTDEQLKEETSTLVRYFLSALTVPAENMWVNLSPYENDRIISPFLADTDLGRDMLAQDYVLKQLAASLTYPESELGKKYWEKVPGADKSTFNKVWIMPDKAQVYESGTKAVITENTLKVMTESDYLAMQNNNTAVNDNSSAAVRELVIPAISKDVNTGKNFAALRQFQSAVILAAWFKVRLKDSLYDQLYIDKNKTKGIELNDPALKDKIYNQYVEAFTKGAYNYIQKQRVGNKVTKRSYFSGGITNEDILSKGPAVIKGTEAGMVPLVEGKSNVVVGLGNAAGTNETDVGVFEKVSKDLELMLTITDFFQSGFPKGNKTRLDAVKAAMKHAGYSEAEIADVAETLLAVAQQQYENADAPISSSGLSFSHRLLHEISDFSEQFARMNELLTSLGYTVKVLPNGKADYASFAKENGIKKGDIFKFTHGSLDISFNEANGVTTVINPAFKSDHAGRDGMIVMARTPAKAVHEQTELLEEDYFVTSNNIVSMFERGKLEGNMGTLIKQWLNDRNVSAETLSARRNAYMMFRGKAHTRAQIAEDEFIKNNPGTPTAGPSALDQAEKTIVAHMGEGIFDMPISSSKSLQAGLLGMLLAACSPTVMSNSNMPSSDSSVQGKNASNNGSGSKQAAADNSDAVNAPSSRTVNGVEIINVQISVDSKSVPVVVVNTPVINPSNVKAIDALQAKEYFNRYVRDFENMDVEPRKVYRELVVAAVKGEASGLAQLRAALKEVNETLSGGVGIVALADAKNKKDNSKDAFTFYDRLASLFRKASIADASRLAFELTALKYGLSDCLGFYGNVRADINNAVFEAVGNLTGKELSKGVPSTRTESINRKIEDLDKRIEETKDMVAKAQERITKQLAEFESEGKALTVKTIKPAMDAMFKDAGKSEVLDTLGLMGSKENDLAEKISDAIHLYVVGKTKGWVKEGVDDNTITFIRENFTVYFSGKVWGIRYAEQIKKLNEEKEKIAKKIAAGEKDEKISGGNTVLIIGNASDILRELPKKDDKDQTDIWASIRNELGAEASSEEGDFQINSDGPANGSTAFTRAAHIQRHIELRIAGTIASIVDELKRKGYNIVGLPHNQWDLRQAVRQYGEMQIDRSTMKIKTDHGYLAINKDGILIIMDNRIKNAMSEIAGHAGRDRMAVYAGSEAKVVHELSELNSWKNAAIALGIISREDPSLLGTRMRRWVIEGKTLFPGNGDMLYPTYEARLKWMQDCAQLYHDMAEREEGLVVTENTDSGAIDKDEAPDVGIFSDGPNGTDNGTINDEQIDPETGLPVGGITEGGLKVDIKSDGTRIPMFNNMPVDVNTFTGFTFTISQLGRHKTGRELVMAQAI